MKHPEENAADWSPNPPTLPGWYEFKCGEGAYETEDVEVELRGDVLLVNLDCGQYPVQQAHDNLENPQWRIKP